MIAAESGTKSSSIDPSSVEAASAFVYKCMASIFTQSVNLRPIMKKKLPEVNPISWAPSDENTSLHGGPVPFAPSVAVPLHVPDGNSPKKPRLMGESGAVIKSSFFGVMIL
ncbi:hypothetical protein MTR67_032052 [Solanum verrucosum]|uniref:Uncharacterized protein n=1 Tax=Solanum verrucosum TaxID=315347 RepID=A0AAF0U3P6_SOLVR|nr:hypothetical protein MTR67_032052 [Solanum verrucosum]